MKRVAIVIVTYNSGSEIGGCLDTLRGLDNAEILVVDNASTDATCDETRSRGVRLLENITNIGFGAAVNAGVRATDAPLILLLNPDAHFITGLDALVRHFEKPQTGAAGGLLVGADGQPQAGFMARNLPTPGTLICEILGINRLWPSNPLNWHYRCRGLNPMTAALVEQPAGAFLMFPRRVWSELEGFDERFWPVWFEDVDFCARLKARQLQVYYEPAAVASHTGGHSVGVLPDEVRQKYWYGSLLKYGARHFAPAAFRAVCLSVVLGAFLRALRGIPRGGAKALAVYSEVVGLALNWFFKVRKGVHPAQAGPDA